MIVNEIFCACFSKADRYKETWNLRYDKNLASCIDTVQLVTVCSVPKANTSVSCSASWRKKAALVGWPSNGLNSCCMFCQFKNWLLRVLVPNQELVINKFSTVLANCLEIWGTSKIWRGHKKRDQNLWIGYTWLSLPPEASSLSSWDHFSPHTYKHWYSTLALLSWEIICIV